MMSIDNDMEWYLRSAEEAISICVSGGFLESRDVYSVIQLSKEIFLRCHIDRQLVVPHLPKTLSLLSEGISWNQIQDRYAFHRGSVQSFWIQDTNDSVRRSYSSLVFGSENSRNFQSLRKSSENKSFEKLLDFENATTVRWLVEEPSNLETWSPTSRSNSFYRVASMTRSSEHSNDASSGDLDAFSGEVVTRRSSLIERGSVSIQYVNTQNGEASSNNSSNRPSTNAAEKGLHTASGPDPPPGSFQIGGSSSSNAGCSRGILKTSNPAQRSVSGDVHPMSVSWDSGRKSNGEGSLRQHSPSRYSPGRHSSGRQSPTARHSPEKISPGRISPHYKRSPKANPNSAGEQKAKRLKSASPYRRGQNSPSIPSRTSSGMSSLGPVVSRKRSSEREWNSRMIVDDPSDGRAPFGGLGFGGLGFSLPNSEFNSNLSTSNLMSGNMSPPDEPRHVFYESPTHAAKIRRTTPNERASNSPSTRRPSTEELPFGSKNGHRLSGNIGSANIAHRQASSKNHLPSSLPNCVQPNDELDKSPVQRKKRYGPCSMKAKRLVDILLDGERHDDLKPNILTESAFFGWKRSSFEEAPLSPQKAIAVPSLLGSTKTFSSENKENRSPLRYVSLDKKDSNVLLVNRFNNLNNHTTNANSNSNGNLPNIPLNGTLVLSGLNPDGFAFANALSGNTIGQPLGNASGNPSTSGPQANSGHPSNNNRINASGQPSRNTSRRQSDDISLVGSDSNMSISVGGGKTECIDSRIFSLQSIKFQLRVFPEGNELCAKDNFFSYYITTEQDDVFITFALFAGNTRRIYSKRFVNVNAKLKKKKLQQQQSADMIPKPRRSWQLSGSGSSGSNDENKGGSSPVNTNGLVHNAMHDSSSDSDVRVPNHSGSHTHPTNAKNPSHGPPQGGSHPQLANNPIGSPNQSMIYRSRSVPVPKVKSTADVASPPPMWGEATFAEIPDPFIVGVEILENPARFRVENQSKNKPIWIVENANQKRKWSGLDDYYTSEPLRQIFYSNVGASGIVSPGVVSNSRTQSAGIPHSNNNDSFSSMSAPGLINNGGLNNNTNNSLSGMSNNSGSTNGILVNTLDISMNDDETRVVRDCSTACSVPLPTRRSTVITFQFVFHFHTDTEAIDVFLKAPLGTTLPALKLFINNQYVGAWGPHAYNILAGFVGLRNIELKFPVEEIAVHVEEADFNTAWQKPDVIPLV